MWLDINHMQDGANFDLINFLKLHQVYGKSEYTHCCFGYPWGKYIIPDQQLPLFMDLYCASSKINVIEGQKLVGPLILDIDMKFSPNTSKRVYHLDDIKYIIAMYNRIINKKFKIKPYNLTTFILEKKRPSFRTGTNGNIVEYKDGFHIQYPYLPINKIMRATIIKKLSNKIKKLKGLVHLNFTNNIEDVFDRHIVSTGWLMYGSKKPNGLKYYLTHIYTCQFNEINRRKYPKEKLVQLLSVRKFNETDEIKPLKPIINKNNNSSNNTTTIKNSTANNQIELATKLVQILDSKRSYQYHDWINVGWTLHNIDKSLFDIFNQFSKKSHNYNLQACQQVWENAKYNGGLTIESLKYWAKSDNSEEYNKLFVS